MVLGNGGVMWFHESSFFEMIVGELFILFFKSGFGWGKNLEICGVELKSVLWSSMKKMCVVVLQWNMQKLCSFGPGAVLDLLQKLPCRLVHACTFKLCETPHSKWLWSPDQRSYHRIFVWTIMGKSPRGKRSDQIWVHARKKPAIQRPQLND